VEGGDPEVDFGANISTIALSRKLLDGKNPVVWGGDTFLTTIKDPDRPEAVEN
jgi:hypothetical protein